MLKIQTNSAFHFLSCLTNHKSYKNRKYTVALYLVNKCDKWYVFACKIFWEKGYGVVPIV